MVTEAKLDEAVRAIVSALDARWPVDAAWLFGSQVRASRADSDIDIAVLFGTPPDPADLLRAGADLEQAAGAPVDVVDLDRASPIIAYQALKNGRLVADRAPSHRVDFVARLPGRYEDVMILRRGMERTLIERVTHGRT